MASLATDSSPHPVTDDRGSRPKASSAIGRDLDANELSNPLAISVSRARTPHPATTLHQHR
eukprot:3482521-Pyramimonas_sp.AAC.1